ncbi:hypothetical protein Ahy_B01g056756 [Arachis hypogaea]|uniref:Vacuolar iron transporter n=1 Tax=Arachis hypogaea TaxID=3818 RepID=A0A445AZI2_ARAHY|nr:hypothetical protein Ahy_B01g056756 [Arachis hypogaea]
MKKKQKRKRNLITQKDPNNYVQRCWELTTAGINGGSDDGSGSNEGRHEGHDIVRFHKPCGRGLDIEIAQIKRQEEEEEDEIEKKSLPNPLQIAAASSFTFSAGAIVPLLVVFFVRNYKFRLELILESDSFVLILFGYLVRLFHLGLMLEPSLVNG